jgi:hypothetical protein
MDQNRIA